MPSSTTPFEGALVPFTKTIASITVPERLKATAGTKFRQATFFGFSNVGGTQTPNTGSVFIGPSATDGANFLEVTPGGQAIMEAVEGTSLDFYDQYGDAQVAGEGVGVLYQA